NSEKVSPIICINYSLSRIGKLMLLSVFLIGLFIIPFVLSLLLIGIPILIYLVVRWYFALPSMVLDNTGVTQSIQKSWDLVDKRWWVTFGTGLVILILMTIPTYALNLVSSNLNSDFILLLGDVLVSTLISPFQAIATGLYFLSLKKYPKI
ncbi:MAG: glycerophosphoryl diester phosphodiesterase membrane domain-containing protein, partial [Chloroflexota bacterium]|nr:glycerophosphoryl diester phosphodiesterase membrane domain-containing protein [Chloroflexota bacterium]